MHCRVSSSYFLSVASPSRRELRQELMLDVSINELLERTTEMKTAAAAAAALLLLLLLPSARRMIGLELRWYHRLCTSEHRALWGPCIRIRIASAI